jgi:hypothetical protein
MATARALFQGHVDGLTATGLDPQTIPLSAAWTIDTAAGVIATVNLLVGTTTLTPPVGATNRLLLLTPPATNVTPIFALGAAADTGVQLAANTSQVLVVAVGAPLLLKVTAEVDGVQLIWL